LSLLPAGKEIKILNLGAGTGLLDLELQMRSADIYSLDNREEAVDFCKQRGLRQAILGRAESLPFAGEQFDVVLAMDILEHVENDSAVAAEIARVLKLGGKVIVTVPAFKFLWSAEDERLHHYRRYDKKTLSALFSGWKIERVSYFNFFLFLPILFARKVLRLADNGEELKIGMRVINKILYSIFQAEVALLGWVNLPFGVSCLGIFSKMT
jgi:ubiquinone/menaquinone biosynthesis C-methylase UbiE